MAATNPLALSASRHLSSAVDLQMVAQLLERFDSSPEAEVLARSPSFGRGGEGGDVLEHWLAASMEGREGKEDRGAEKWLLQALAPRHGGQTNTSGGATGGQQERASVVRFHPRSPGAMMEA